jgi:hypothetical protein
MGGLIRGRNWGAEVAGSSSEMAGGGSHSRRVGSKRGRWDGEVGGLSRCQEGPARSFQRGGRCHALSATPGCRDGKGMLDKFECDPVYQHRLGRHWCKLIFNPQPQTNWGAAWGLPVKMLSYRALS